MATVWTTYQGVEVSQFDPVVKCQHPRWGSDSRSLMRVNGATLLALADGTFVVACNRCDYNGLTGNDPYVKPEGEYKSIMKQASSVLVHINNKHHVRVTSLPERRLVAKRSRYTDDQIRIAIRVWLKWHLTGIRHWAQSACDELERLGFRPISSGKWNPDQLGKLVRLYMNRDEFQDAKARALDSTDQETLAEMLRTTAERVRGDKTLASVARITTTRARKTPPPVDDSRAEEIAPDPHEAPQREEEDVTSMTEDPKLSFARSGESSSTVKLVVSADESSPASVDDGSYKPESVQKDGSAYGHVTELDGKPVFVYGKRKVLMVGVPIRGFQT